MQPSSRTPEGDNIQCRICGHEVCIEPSMPPGDAPCPHCGTLLWFPSDSSPERQAAVDSTPVGQAAADSSPERQAAVDSSPARQSAVDSTPACQAAADSSRERQAAELWQQAQSAIETENWLEAVRCLRRAIAHDPSNIVFRVTLAKVRPRVLIR